MKKQIIKAAGIISVIIIAIFVSHNIFVQHKTDTGCSYSSYTQMQIWNSAAFAIWEQAADELKGQMTENLQEYDSIFELDIKTDEAETKFRVTVHIGAENEYETLLQKMAKLSAQNPDKHISLSIHVDDYSNIKLYLDEIAASGAITSLDINRGVIATKADSTFHNDTLTKLDFYDVKGIDGDILKGLEAANDLTIRLDTNAEADMDVIGLLNSSACKDTKIIIYDYSKRGRLPQGLINEQQIIDTAEKEKRFLRAVYKLHEDGYCYTAYLLNDIFKDNHPHVFICIEGEEPATEGYFDIVEIPADAEYDIYAHERQPIRLEDVNFDGYKDINFVGWSTYHDFNYYRFLWNPDNKKFELNKTAPSFSCKVEAEQKRLVVSDEKYYIYTYEDSRFYEKSIYTNHNINGREWDYYENGILVANLFWKENIGEGAYLYTDSKGSRIEGTFQADNEKDVADLQQQFFPDFDFISYETDKSNTSTKNNNAENAIEIGERFDYYWVETGTDVTELFNDTELKDIQIIIHDLDESERLLTELVKEQKIIDTAGAEKRYLAAVYRVREDGYCYTAYILNDIIGDNHPHVFVCIEGEEAATAGYYDIIEIMPNSKMEISANEAQPIRLEDVNFDGYKDLNFIDDADHLSIGNNIYIFLWEPTSGKYEWCESAPSYWGYNGYADDKRQRITTVSHLSAADETYYIYTYANGVYTEKALHTIHDDSIAWDYYENGEMKGSLLWMRNSGGGVYLYTDKEGVITEGIFMEDDEKDWTDLQEQFFPEFDFYNNG